jgi:hypothetical protein
VYTTELLSATMPRLTTSVALFLILTGCANNEHTLESTRDLSNEELAALCEDLQMRASMDCEWNMREQQSSVNDRQTWEISCRSRRDSARRSFDNVCQAWRFRPEGGAQPPE